MEQVVTEGQLCAWAEGQRFAEPFEGDMIRSAAAELNQARHDLVAANTAIERLELRLTDREEELKAREDAPAVQAAREGQRLNAIWVRRVEESAAQTAKLEKELSIAMERVGMADRNMDASTARVKRYAAAIKAWGASHGCADHEQPVDWCEHCRQQEDADETLWDLYIALDNGDEEESELVSIPRVEDWIAEGNRELLEVRGENERLRKEARLLAAENATFASAIDAVTDDGIDFRGAAAPITRAVLAATDHCEARYARETETRSDFDAVQPLNVTEHETWDAYREARTEIPKPGSDV